MVVALWSPIEFTAEWAFSSVLLKTSCLPSITQLILVSVVARGGGVMTSLRLLAQPVSWLPRRQGLSDQLLLHLTSSGASALIRYSCVQLICCGVQHLSIPWYCRSSTYCMWEILTTFIMFRGPTKGYVRSYTKHRVLQSFNALQNLVVTIPWGGGGAFTRCQVSTQKPIKKDCTKSCRLVCLLVQ